MVHFFILVNAKTPFLALVTEIFPRISSLCLHSLSSRMLGYHNFSYPDRAYVFVLFFWGGRGVVFPLIVHGGKKCAGVEIHTLTLTPGSIVPLARSSSEWGSTTQFPCLSPSIHPSLGQAAGHLIHPSIRQVTAALH